MSDRAQDTASGGPWFMICGSRKGDHAMSHKGFSHIGLSTHDLDATRDFYENVLGFKAVRCDIIKVKEGGRIRHVFFDTGRDQLIAFMEARGVPGVSADYDAGITCGLGVPRSITSPSRRAPRPACSRSATS
jgi:catechol 2,3-dioxygenase-like lactoylglutathione lyase family enzyme